MKQPVQSQKTKRLKIAIIILAVLLVLSAGGLAARFVYLAYFAPTQATATVPDNLIGNDSSLPDSSLESQTSEPITEPVSSQTAGNHTEADKPAVRLELYQGKPEVNQRFEVRNMFPGDTETKYFCVKTYHDKDIELFFKVDNTEQTKNLGDVLHIKVTRLETGRVLCDAPFAEVNGKEFSELLKASGEKSTIAYYQIEVSLEPSVGNEYQAAMLKADFKWYVKDEGGLIPPQTGDATHVTLWIVLAASSLLLILLLAFRRKKEDDSHDE